MIHALSLALTLGLATAPQAAATEVTVAAQGHAFNPSWSPDGQYVAFEVNRFEESADLYVLKVQNGNPVGAPQKVTIPGSGSSFGSKGGVATAPAWHPEGQLIFEGSNSGGAQRLYYWAPGGQSAAELLKPTQIQGDLSWPSISPDGSMVTFVSDTTGLGDVYTWDRNSNQVSMAVSSPYSEMAPRFSGDASRVAYSRKNRGGEDLFVLVDGKSSPHIGGTGDQSRPAWAGDSLVFFSNERGDGKWDIAVSAGVGKKQTIARDVRLPLRAPPALSPDGKWVAYGLNTPEADGVIALTSLDGARTIKIATGLQACGEPALVAAGGRTFLAFTALPSAGADWRKLQLVDVTDQLK